MRYTIRPISDRTWLGTMGREGTRFSASWSDTKELLAREVAFLKGRDVVLECDVREQDIRIDGTLRANAKVDGGAVAIAFESKHGPLMYRCDRFVANWSHQGPAWQHNVRAIALTLEALRAVDRYGATETGQQYAGFKALPAGRAMPASHMTRDEAIALLERVAIGNEGHLRDRTIREMEDDPAVVVEVYRQAARACHPDRRRAGPRPRRQPRHPPRPGGPGARHPRAHVDLAGSTHRGDVRRLGGTADKQNPARRAAPVSGVPTRKGYPMRTSETLNKAADLIEERGWKTGSGWDITGLDVAGPLAYDGGATCLEGGIQAAAGISIEAVDGACPPRIFAGLMGCPAYQAVAAHLEWTSKPLFLWNDRHGRTAAEVVEVLRACALIEAAREEQDAVEATYADNLAASR